MGRKSREAEQRRSVRRARPELLEALARQRGFLRRSAQAFDEGDEYEAVRLAAVLRVLLHDTGGSHSLLGQLDLTRRLRFVNTAAPIMPTNVEDTPGLVLMRIGWGEGGRYLPRVLGPPGSPFEPSPPLGFADWWTLPVSKIGGRLWTRKALTLMLANKEGGSHIDPEKDEDYHRIEKENALGWTYFDSDGVKHFEGNFVAAAVRQIAHEVELTFAANEQLVAAR